MQIQPEPNMTTSQVLVDPSLVIGTKHDQPIVASQTKTLQVTAVQKDQQQEVLNSLNSVQKHLDMMKDTSFQIDFDKDIDRVIIKYVSTGTGEVVNQIPSKEFVNFEKEFVKTIGLLFDKRV